MAILKYSVRFNLQHNSDKNKDTAIRCVVRFNNERVTFGTNVKINPRFWSIKTQEPKSTNSFDASGVTSKMEEIRNFVKAEFGKLENYPDPNQFKEMCENFIVAPPPGPEKKQEATLIKYMAALIEKMRSGAKRVSDGGRMGRKYSIASIKGYESVLSVFERFAAYSGKRDFAFDDITKGFYDDLQDYFYNELKLSSGYFATVIKTLKTVMRDAKDEKLHNNTDYNSRHFIKPVYESDTVYLTVDQLNRLNKADLEEGFLSHARDVFLIGCWTGLRFSDFSVLTTQDIEGDYIRVLTTKTGSRVTIPCHPVIKEILERNGGNFPDAISNQKLNENIKVVARLSGLSKKVEFKKNVGGNDVFEEVNFCDLVSTHTARRSFATNMFKLGIPTLIIMAITGHKTEAAFLKYIRVSNEEKAQMMMEMWSKLGIFK